MNVGSGGTVATPSFGARSTTVGAGGTTSFGAASTVVPGMSTMSGGGVGGTVTGGALGCWTLDLSNVVRPTVPAETPGRSLFGLAKRGSYSGGSPGAGPAGALAAGTSFLAV